MTTTFDPRYVLARRVLLDALEALQQHRAAIVLVGAQAVYLQAGDADLAVAPYITDADLALIPDFVDSAPLLSEVMEAAGFALRQPRAGQREPGMWFTTRPLDGQRVDIPVDLLVPEAYAPLPGRRSAEIPPHGRFATRRTPGIEAAVVDHDPWVITSLEPDRDVRTAEIAVAGPAALLVAKLHKLADRIRDFEGGRPDRLSDKDAADIFRLIRTQRIADLRRRFGPLRTDPRIAPVVAEAVEHLARLFGRPNSAGVEAAGRALGAAVPETVVRQLCTVYTAALLDALTEER